MMITCVAMSDITHHQASLPNTSILLASHTINDRAKLIWCNWLETADCWQDKIKLSSLAKHYQFDSMDTKFITVAELNGSNPEQQLLLASIAQLQQYLQGTRRVFDLPIDTTLGTVFQQQVWQALQDIEHGETISYATLAQRVGNPKGYRAAANANGKNPLSIIIPCHRVISSDGKLGGYTGGLDKKEYLLALEGIECKL